MEVLRLLVIILGGQLNVRLAQRLRAMQAERRQMDAVLAVDDIDTLEEIANLLFGGGEWQTTDANQKRAIAIGAICCC